MSRLARHFTDLEVYQIAAAAAHNIHEVARRLPRTERSLSDQMLRSARAVPALLAEAWGRRPYRRAFCEKLSQALGEAMETEAWIDCARRSSYLPEGEYEDMTREWHSIGAMIRQMMKKSTEFAGKGPPR